MSRRQSTSAEANPLTLKSAALIAPDCAGWSAKDINPMPRRGVSRYITDLSRIRPRILPAPPTTTQKETDQNEA